MAPGRDPTRWRVGLVGYGEVGKILAEDLRGRDIAVFAYDVKLDAHPDTPDWSAGEAMRTHAHHHGVGLAPSHRELAAHADLIVSAVTANQAVPAHGRARPASAPQRSSSTSTPRRPAPRRGLPHWSMPRVGGTSRAPS